MCVGQLVLFVTAVVRCSANLILSDDAESSQYTSRLQRQLLSHQIKRSLQSLAFENELQITLVFVCCRLSRCCTPLIVEFCHLISVNQHLEKGFSRNSRCLNLSKGVNLGPVENPDRDLTETECQNYCDRAPNLFCAGMYNRFGKALFSLFWGA